jgi:hypothetical protein
MEFYHTITGLAKRLLLAISSVLPDWGLPKRALNLFLVAGTLFDGMFREVG